MMHLDAERLVAFLQQQVAIFKDFPPDRLGELVDGSQVTTYEANQAIVKFGEEGWFIGVLIDGVAKVCHTDDSGQTYLLGTLSSGDIFGEMAVMTGEKRMADIIGVDRCTALLIPLALFSSVLATHPPAVRFLSRIISERSRQLGTLDARKETKSSVLGKSDDSHGLSPRGDTPEKLLVPIEVSAHHVHLCQEHVEALFGPGHRLTPAMTLSQPGQFTCREQVNLIGPRGRIDRVRVIGPARNLTQVEIAMTEQFKLGILPPIRESGDVEQSPGILLEGPAGTVSLDKGVICALRHIHLSPEDALRFGLRDQHRVRVRVEGNRELIFGDVLVRVHPNFRLAMHIDTDEANAANIGAGAVGYIDGLQS